MTLLSLKESTYYDYVRKFIALSNSIERNPVQTDATTLHNLKEALEIAVNARSPGHIEAILHDLYIFTARFRMTFEIHSKPWTRITENLQAIALAIHNDSGISIETIIDTTETMLYQIANPINYH